MRVAIVHDWLVTIAGAEKVLAEIIKIYPDADLYSVVDHLDDDMREKISNKKSTSTFLQKFPFSKNKYRSLLPLMPFAIEQLNLSGYDLIISSSHAVAKGVISGPDQLHICYCHSPIRYAWDLQSQYLRESGLETGIKSLIARYILYKIRGWDYRSAAGVDYFISNSDYIGRRIHKVYGQESFTIYPNVAVEDFEVFEDKEDFYLTASRMVPYKKIDLIVESFSRMPDKKLVVIGDGPQYEKVKNSASDNVEILGYQDFNVLKSYMKKARAFVFAAEEDFGIIPVEAQACGTPVIAYGKGGALETVIEGVTGVFFKEQSVESIESAVIHFESEFVLNTDSIRSHSEKFSTERFAREFESFVKSKIEKSNFL